MRLALKPEDCDPFGPKNFARVSTFLIKLRSLKKLWQVGVGHHPASKSEFTSTAT